MKIPKSTLKINVKNTFKDGEKVNVYYYDEDKNEIVLVKDNIIVKGNEVEFTTTKGKNYFITRATIEGTAHNYYKPIAIIEGIALLVLIVMSIPMTILNNNHLVEIEKFCEYKQNKYNFYSEDENLNKTCEKYLRSNESFATNFLNWFWKLDNLIDYFYF